MFYSQLPQNFFLRISTGFSHNPLPTKMTIEAQFGLRINSDRRYCFKLKRGQSKFDFT